MWRSNAGACMGCEVAFVAGQAGSSPQEIHCYMPWLDVVGARRSFSMAWATLERPIMNGGRCRLRGEISECMRFSFSSPYVFFCFSRPGGPVEWIRATRMPQETSSLNAAHERLKAGSASEG